MKAELKGNPDFGHVVLTLAAGERVLAESGAMAHMSSGLEIKTRLLGGIFSSLARRLLAGESLLVSQYQATAPATLTLSPSSPGQVLQRRLEGESVYLTAGSFLAATPGITIKTRFMGLKAIFSGEGMFSLVCSGKGGLWFNAYGAVLERQVDGAFQVDTGHVVAWEPSLGWRVRGMGGLFATLFSGEGLILEFKGHGRVWVQTRSVGGLVGWLRSYL